MIGARSWLADRSPVVIGLVSERQPKDFLGIISFLAGTDQKRIGRDIVARRRAERSRVAEP